MVKSLAQSETRATFERVLSNRYSSIAEIYESMLDDVEHQVAELAALAKRVLRMMLDAIVPVLVSKLRNTSALELADIASAQGLERDLTDQEIAEIICSSSKGFVSTRDLGTSGLQLLFVHQSAADFLRAHLTTE